MSPAATIFVFSQDLIVNSVNLNVYFINNKKTLKDKINGFTNNDADLGVSSKETMMSFG